MGKELLAEQRSSLIPRVRNDIFTVKPIGKEMKSSSTISSKGQITVPQRIRERLGVSAGDRVEFVIDGDKTLIRPVREVTNPFSKYAGVLGTFSGGKKEINEWLDELRSDEQSQK